MITEKTKLLVLLACLPIYTADASRFVEVTTDSGIDYIGQSKGAAWADYNGDSWPDVWVTNRYNKFRLYVNNGDGTFTDSSSVITSSSNSAYGAAWGDFDNDGDPDILNAGPGACGGQCGSASANKFLVNDSGFLVNQAASYGVDYPLGRGRMPLWFDWNADGRLDLLLANAARPDGVAPTALFTQDKDGFLDDTEMAVISSKSSEFAQLARFAPGSPPRLVMAGGSYPLGIYDYSVLPFLDIKERLGLPVTGGPVQDAIIADFNGDLLADVFLARANQYPSAAVLIDANRLAAVLIVGGDQKAFRFKAKGNVHFEIFGNSLTPSELYIGENATVDPGKLQFTLSDDDPAVRGIQPHEPGADTGIYIGYQPIDGFWEVQLSSPNRSPLRSFRLEADSPISELITMGFDNSDDGERTDRLFLQTTNGFLDTTAVAGLDTPTPCGSAVAVDFDNDMDLDIYMVCRGAITNRANILYENLGDGTFRAVPEAGGAAGSTLGRGDSVATADFDLDGFMDLLVTNGDNDSPFNRGPHQLFRNLGNKHHWLEIDLEGTASNRDGIGAQVVATAAGITQVRDQNGGVHLYSQNHQRIHFGLGTATSVDKLEIFWPSGIKQTLTNVAMNQVVTVSEQDISNNTPIVGGTPETRITQGRRYSFTPTASDLDGNTLLFSITNKPTWADFNTKTGELSGTPGNSDVGITNDIVITANDQQGQPNSTANLTSFNLEVININDAPVARTPIGSHAATQGTPFGPLNVSNNFSDVDGDTLSFSMSGVPAESGMSISATGTISGTPTSVDAVASPMIVTVTGTDPSSASASAIFTLSVASIDSNKDGISDAKSIELGLDPNAPDGDTDRDGITDVVEIGDQNTPLDRDDDGTSDALDSSVTARDPSVASNLQLENGNTVSIATTAGEFLSKVSAQVAIANTPGTRFPFGAISYTATSTIGGSVTVLMSFSADLPANLLVYKMNTQGVYAILPVDLWSQIDSRTIKLTLTDGDTLTDLDRIANGSIDDPIALGIASSAEPVVTVEDSGNGGGGCTLNAFTRNDPTFPLLMLVSLLYLFLGQPMQKIKGR